MTNQYQFNVSVSTTYLLDQSSEEDNQFVFSYTVKITNVGTIAAQLISRHWIIMNADNQRHEVKGLGVIGKQPLLQPNENFEYTSGTVLETSVGSMQGSYQIVAVDGTTFEVTIPPFTLAVPRTLH